jgi:hypothetical protein
MRYRDKNGQDWANIIDFLTIGRMRGEVGIAMSTGCAYTAAMANDERDREEEEALCPRCGLKLDRMMPGGVGIPTLSRTDNKAIVCAPCGADEASLWAHGLPVTPQSEWPVESAYKS